MNEHRGDISFKGYYYVPFSGVGKKSKCIHIKNQFLYFMTVTTNHLKGHGTEQKSSKDVLWYFLAQDKNS